MRLMRQAGALGARLTGAGFGGFVIALCESANAAAIRDRLTQEFYLPRGVRAEPNIMILSPAGGAKVEGF